MVFEEAVVTHRIEATCASPNGIEAKCASLRWRPNPEIDWHRDRYPRDMINPAGRNHVIRQRSPSSNATKDITTRLRGINHIILLYYSPKPCSDVFCFKLNFNISKLGYWINRETSRVFLVRVNRQPNV